MSDRSIRLDVHTPSEIDLTTNERVQLRRVEGDTALRHGGLLSVGTNRLSLAPGVYHFRTLDAAALDVVAGGVKVTSGSLKKGLGADPVLGPAGAGPEGELPALVVTGAE
jgi:hypothetical protein